MTTTNQGYNPVLDSGRVERFGLTSQRSPRPGTALVLTRRDGGHVVVEPGQPVPSLRWGAFHWYAVVNTSSQHLLITSTGPSNDHAYSFEVTTRMVCRVLDPARLVGDDRSGARNLASALAPSVEQVVRHVSHRHDPLATIAVERAVREALTRTAKPDWIALSDFKVTATCPDAGQLAEARRAIKVEQLRRDALQEVAGGGRDALLAQTMINNNGDPLPYLDRENAVQEQQAKQELEVVKLLLDQGNLAPHEAAAVRTAFLESRFGGHALPRTEGIRNRLTRRSPGALDRGPVIEGDSTPSP
ncbi:hypothetical protein KCV87_04855 [Actinosynnema pretiosum subsp. pretiosum]|uniref:Band 7 domain-containing protein n=1 Tax=Actinosynnema pretiosum subsp. pretiosum TaxID=103721 RepID=A0AA45L8S6_9PSEU|nr:hypothetical protein APASM_3051 [Actinosynnema pretiosum subsp. pretiosum]QUF05436.1 hypothetical protein KCV87_04855 [Actinosynnema pretiosum subsp. pretiosum]